MMRANLKPPISTGRPLGVAIAAACLLAAATLGFGAHHEEAAATVEHEIRELTDRMWSALGDQDLEAFQEVCAEEWQLYTAGGSKFSAERLFSVHRENIRNFRLDAENFEVHVGDGMAWATYDAVMSGERQGDPWGGDFLMTHIYERRDGEWVCVHTHESRSE